MEICRNCSSVIFKCYDKSPGYHFTDAAILNYKAAGYINVLLCISAIFLNSCFLLTISKIRKLRTRKNALLIVLSANDLLTASLAQTFFASSMFQLSAKNLPCITMTVASVAGYTFGVATFNTLFFIAGERYTAVVHPFRYNEWVTCRNLILCNITAYTGTITAVVVSYSIRNYIFLNVFLVLLFFTTGFIMFYCNCKIAYTSRILTKNAVTGICTSVQKKQRSDKATIVATLLVVAVAVCCLPTLFYSLYSLLGTNRQFGHRHILPWVQTLALLNGTLNPLIYYYRMKDFRSAIKAQLGIKRVGFQIGLTQIAITPNGATEMKETTQKQHEHVCKSVTAGIEGKTLGERWTV